MSNNINDFGNDILDLKKISEHIWEVPLLNNVGQLLYTFDKRKVYNLWIDYPWEFSKQELEIFEKEVPFWADFFSDRKQYKNKTEYQKFNGN